MLPLCDHSIAKDHSVLLSGGEDLIMKKHPTLKKILLSSTMFLAFLVVAELGFRVVRRIVKGPDIERAETIADPDLGWRLNTHRNGIRKLNKCDETVITQKYDHPFLVKRPQYENITSVLFLGDSSTQAHEVSTGSAYYDVFEELTKDRYSVFAAGIGGFGNLQEFLLLQKVATEVKPDIVIWQLARNDVSNNVYALDAGSFYNNQNLRPYLDVDTGVVYFQNPGFFLFDVSYLFRFLFHRMLTLDWKYKLGLLDAADALIAPTEEDLPHLKMEGLDVLASVLDRAIIDYPDTKFFGFSADEEFDREFSQIFERAGAAYFDGVSQIVASDPQPTDCLPLDGHWNHHGNQVAGHLLEKLLNQADIK
jgi:hypothetical protein